MSTNYYLRENICDKCNRYDEIHIGKSSHGWRFLFEKWIKDFENEYPEDKIAMNYEKWKERLTNSKGIIINEYEENVSPKEFFEFVEARQKVFRSHLEDRRTPGLNS